MYVYCYYGIITFVIKLVIKKKVKLVIIYTFDWLSRYIVYYVYVGSQIAAHTLMETGNGPNEPNTINL